MADFINSLDGWSVNVRTYNNGRPVRSPSRKISFAPRAARIVLTVWYLPSDIAQTHDTRFEIGSWRFYFLRNIIIIKGRIDERGSPWAHHNFFCRSPIWMLFRLYIIYFHHEKWLYQVSAPEIKYWKTSWSTILQHTVGVHVKGITSVTYVCR